MHLSIVIPLFNEEKSLDELYSSINKTISTINVKYEVIFIDDGSTDSSWNTIKKIVNNYPNVKGIKFLRNFGKSQALSAGFKDAKGDVIITLDADLQDDPNEILSLYELMKNENFDLVSGWKKKRYDS